ncbi:HTH domain-containing protein [Haloarcula sp. JP-L23]|uniref:HTH domain-containing protein n=1 Tax=Haloarcula sp. JP-L23 TaxID=2716717 RepID=UPI0032E50A53
MRSAEQQSDRADTEPKGQAERVETGTHVELWLRGNPPACVRDAQEEAYERLQRLKRAGRIPSVTSHVWEPIETTPRATDPEHTAVYRETISEFRDWANERGYSLCPGFQTRDMTPMLADESREEIVPPILCLAVYVDDTLTTVFPHADGECVHTVTDGLDRLEAETEDPFVGGAMA